MKEKINNLPIEIEESKLDRNDTRFRIGWHSCRRWFETRIWEKYKDKMQLRDIMRYSHSKVVDTYIDPYEIWKNEQNILDDTFGSLFQDFNQVSKGQTKLMAF